MPGKLMCVSYEVLVEGYFLLFSVVDHYRLSKCSIEVWVN